MTEPTLLEKPTPPADSECCDSACNPCVWDHYYAALKAWRIQQAELKEKQELTSK
ncbi:oxidoreductase-like domain-containing protein [Thalassotalea sediminis]|uniref:oxidoreductase-like domain-containing protein n=1 Tax=Thalassotalea sediminis TaxID=1759089 RepID=UPI002574729A|nr:oxidoreductase-like domain-containing protein [Thalassotalea sediminis]